MFQLRVSKGISEQQLVAPMRKAGDVFGPKPRMISNRPVLVLDWGWWSPESSYIRFHVTRTFIQAGPFFPCHFARAAAAKKLIWTPEALLKILEEMSIELF